MAKQPAARTVLIILLVAAAILCIPFHIKPENFVVDDGYFYPQIARHIASGEGSTFNGIMPTNGYHPLWMIVCVLAALITQKSLPLLQLLTVVQDILTLASLTLFVLICQNARKRGAILGCAPILFFATVLGIWRLLEANLALFLQLLTLAVAIPVLPALQLRIERHRNILLGAMFGLTILARLDLVFFVATILTYQLIVRNPQRIRSVLIQILVLSTVLLPYLLFNLHVFHHLEPVSGAIKSTFPHPHAWKIPSVAFPVLAASFLNALLLFKSRKDPFSVLCLLTATAATLHLIFSLSFGDVAPWYLTSGYLSVSLCIVWLFDALPRPAQALQWLEPTLAIALFTAFLVFASLRIVSNISYSRLVAGMFSVHGSYREPKRDLARKLRATFPPNSRLFIFDAPGGVAYDSGMSIVPVDGLVADYQYNYILVQEGAAAFAANNHIDYLIAPYVHHDQRYDRLFLTIMRDGDRQSVKFLAPLTRRKAGTIYLDDDNLLFLAAEINPDLEATFPQVGVWRIPIQSSTVVRQH